MNDKLRSRIFEYMYKTQRYDKISFVDKNLLNEEYDKEKLNSFFHESVLKMLITYENDPKYKPFYVKFFNKLSVVSNYYKEYQEYMNSQNLKQFFLDIKFDHKEGYKLYLRDDFIGIKTISNNDQVNFKKILNDAIIGFFYLNKLKYLLPNFTYTYCYMECTKIEMNENKIIGWCHETQQRKSLYPYLFREFVPNSISLRNYLNGNLSVKNIMKLIYQFFNVCNLLRQYFTKFSISGINLDNLFVFKTKEKIPIPLYNTNKMKDLTQIGTLNTRKILYLMDYSEISIDDDGPFTKKSMNYKDLISMINKEKGMNIYFSGIYDRQLLKVINYEYNYVVELPEALDKDFIQNKIVEYCLRGNNRPDINEKFIQYVKNEINWINIKIDVENIHTIYDRYVKLLNILGKARCIDYTVLLYDLFQLKITISELVYKNEDQVYTIEKLYQDIPGANKFINFISELPFREIIYFGTILFIVFIAFFSYLKITNNLYTSYEEKLIDRGTRFDNMKTDTELNAKYLMTRRNREKLTEVKSLLENMKSNNLPVVYDGVTYTDPDQLQEYISDLSYNFTTAYLDYDNYYKNKYPFKYTKVLTENIKLPPDTFLKSFFELIIGAIKTTIDFQSLIPGVSEYIPYQNFRYVVDIFIDNKGIPYEIVYLALIPLISIQVYELLKKIINMLKENENPVDIVKMFFDVIIKITKDPYVRLKIKNLFSSNFSYMIKMMWQKYKNGPQNNDENIVDKIEKISGMDNPEINKILIDTINKVEGNNPSSP